MIQNKGKLTNQFSLRLFRIICKNLIKTYLHLKLHFIYKILSWNSNNLQQKHKSNQHYCNLICNGLIKSSEYLPLQRPLLMYDRTYIYTWHTLYRGPCFAISTHICTAAAISSLESWSYCVYIYVCAVRIGVNECLCLQCVSTLGCESCVLLLCVVFLIGTSIEFTEDGLSYIKLYVNDVCFHSTNKVR